MTSLFNAFGDLLLVAGLIIGAAAIVLLNRIGLLPKKSIPYALLALGGAFGITWFKSRQARELRRKLKEEQKRLEQLEERTRKTKETVGVAEERLEVTRAEVEARRDALEESIVELERRHEDRLREIDELEGDELDAEMVALHARLRGEGQT